MSIAQLTGKLYPDKSFSLGIVPKKKKTPKDAQYEHDREAQDSVDYSSVTDWLLGTTNIHGEFCSLSENPKSREEVWKARPGSEGAIEVLKEVEKVTDGDYSKFYGVTENMLEPLFIKSPKSSQKKRGVYGKHGITNYGRRFTKNACILLQRKYGRRRLGFATATLPGMDRDTCDRINGAISDITRRFYQKIRRKYKARNSEFIYVGCIEIQENRFADTQIAAPHLHFVYVAKDSVRAGYTLNTKDFYTAWNESVNEVLKLAGHAPIMGNGGHIGSVKVESIRTSAAAYLGKYLSKGIGVVKAMREEGYTNFPKQWWTASMQMKKMFKESIICLHKDVCKYFFYEAEECLRSGDLTYIYRIYITYNDIDVCVGLYGVLSDKMYDMFHSMYHT